MTITFKVWQHAGYYSRAATINIQGWCLIKENTLLIAQYGSITGTEHAHVSPHLPVVSFITLFFTLIATPLMRSQCVCMGGGGGGVFYEFASLITEESVVHRLSHEAADLRQMLRDRMCHIGTDPEGSLLCKLGCGWTKCPY